MQDRHRRAREGEDTAVHAGAGCRLGIRFLLASRGPSQRRPACRCRLTVAGTLSLCSTWAEGGREPRWLLECSGPRSMALYAEAHSHRLLIAPGGIRMSSVQCRQRAAGV